MSKPIVPIGVQERAERSSLPAWPVAVAIGSALLMAAGGVIALVRPEMLASGGSAISSGMHVYASYLVSRNLAIAAFLLIAVGMKAPRALANYMLLAATVQLIDAVFDCLDGRWALVPGILIIGICLFMAARRVAAPRFWKRSFSAELPDEVGS